MSISPATQAILLLTSHFAKAEGGAVRPLTPKEWGRFALWLKEKDLTPEQLMTGRLAELLNGWSDRSITLDRVQHLMERGSALALAMEKWLRAGLWVMTRSDPDYPIRLKQRLRTDSPAILFGCGNRLLLNGGGLAVVGSRNAADKDLGFARDIGVLAAAEGYSIVSGSARGVDESSMLGALEAEGTVIGVLADSLLRSCSSKKYRKHLIANNLVLISSFHPDAGFNAGNAMQRNKYIYCLSDAALVVRSGTKGGTWNGAMENLKKRWVPLWVKKDPDHGSGNAAIVNAGAAWMTEDIKEADLHTLFSTRERGVGYEADLFQQAGSGVRQAEAEYHPEPSREPANRPETDSVETSRPGAQIDRPDGRAATAEGRTGTPPSTASSSFYDLFLVKVQTLCRESPTTTDELAEALDVNKTQLNVWLKKAVAEQRLKKLSKPVRYQWVTTVQGTLPL